MNFLDTLCKNTHVKMHESTSSGAELFHAGGWTDKQTDMTKPGVAIIKKTIN